MRLIPNDQKTLSSKVYDKLKKPGSKEEALKIICLDENVQNLKLNRQDLREKLINFEKEICKNAVWGGKVTKAFLQYLTGQKLYERSKEKERIAFYLSVQKKKEWHEFIEKNKHISNFSKLIRGGVDYYIKQHLSSSTLESDISDKDSLNICFTIKESLTAIKGFSQLLLKKYREEFNIHVINTIENIIEQCTALESKVLNNREDKSVDVLLIEDDDPTTRLFEQIFKNKGRSYIIAPTGQKGLYKLKKTTPKLVLLDIMLPDINGCEICKQIKKDSDLKQIPVFYVTAVDKEYVKSQIEETGADGYILKPFELETIEQLLDTVT